jgi:hypothetical protein
MPRVCFLLVSLFLFVLSTQWVSSSSLVAQTIPQLHLPMVAVGSSAQATTTVTYTPAATQTPTQTATPSPTPTPTFTLTPTPTPGPTGEVVVVQSNLFTTTGELTSVYLVGEVQNNTNRHVETVEISAILREKGGAIVIGAQERVLVPRLKPGDLAPFHVVMLSPSPWDKYELTVNWSESAEPPVGLDVMEHEGYFGQFDSYRVRGLIRNQTEQVRESVRVVITIYDAAGQVIGADFAYTNPSTLQPGQAIPFDVEVFAWAGKPDRTLVAQHRTAAYSDEECCSCTLLLPHPSC